MAVKYRESVNMNDSVGLLMSILMCYPGICTVRYIPEKNSLKFSYLMKEGFSDSKIDTIKAVLSQSIVFYAETTRKRISPMELVFSIVGEMGQLEILCGIVDLTREEINMVNEIVINHFPGVLTFETKEPMLEEDRIYQEAYIDSMLDSMRDCAPQRYLIGFREEGRVMVYNK